MICLQGKYYLSSTELKIVGINPHIIHTAIMRGSKSWTVIPHPIDKRKKLVEYDSMRDKYKLRIVEKLGPPSSWEGKELASENKVCTLDLDLMRSIQNAAPTLATVQVESIAKACAWMSLLARGHAAAGFTSKQALFDHALLEMKGLPVSLTPEGLRRKLREFKRKGVNAFLHGNLGNKNANKISSPQASALKALYSDPRKLSIAQCTEQYNAKSEINGWPQLTRQAVNEYLKRPAVQAECFKPRHGGKAPGRTLDGYQPIVLRSRPSFADALWVGDGTSIELVYKEGNKEGRLQAYVVLDAFSWKIVGWAMGETETGKLVYNAYKMACKMSGHLPWQILNDNSSAVKNAQSVAFLNSLARYVTFAVVGNAKAKPVEGWFARFNEKVLRYEYNHSGGNITAKRLNTHANTDALRLAEKPTREGVILQFARAVARWNELPHLEGPSPNERYAQAHDKRRFLTVLDQVRLFWLWRAQGIGANARKLSYTYTNSGLEVVINGQKEHYMAPAGGNEEEIATFFADNMGERFHVKYDPDDTSQVMLFRHGADEVPMAMAQERQRVPMAIVDFTDGDGLELQRVRRISERTGELLDERAAASAAEAEDVLRGGISLGNVQKDALNRAEEQLKRLELAGFLNYTPPASTVDRSNILYGEEATYEVIRVERDDDDDTF